LSRLTLGAISVDKDQAFLVQAKKLIHTLVGKHDQVSWQIAVFKLRQKEKLFFLSNYLIIHKLTMTLNVQLNVMRPKARALALTGVRMEAN
jgi:hypothetical protein